MACPSGAKYRDTNPGEPYRALPCHRPASRPRQPVAGFPGAVALLGSSGSIGRIASRTHRRMTRRGSSWPSGEGSTEATGRLLFGGQLCDRHLFDSPQFISRLHFIGHRQFSSGRLCGHPGLSCAVRPVSAVSLSTAAPSLSFVARLSLSISNFGAFSKALLSRPSAGGRVTSPGSRHDHPRSSGIYGIMPFSKAIS